MGAVTMLLVALAPSASSPPKAAAAPVAGWGNLLVAFSYLEQGDPVGLPADPVQMPEILRVLRRMGVDAMMPVHQWPDGLADAETYWQQLWRHDQPKLVIPSFSTEGPAGAWASFHDAKRSARTGEWLDGLGRRYAGRLVTLGKLELVDWDAVNPAVLPRYQRPDAIDFGAAARQALAEWLQGYYRDETPAADSNNDGRTMAGETGVSARSWAALFPTDESLRSKIGAKFTYPRLYLLWTRWRRDHIWRRYYARLAEEHGFQRLVGHNCRVHQAGSLVSLHVGLPGYRALAEDYWTRRQPDKWAALHLDAALPVVGTQEDPAWMHRLLAGVFSSVSRLRAIHIRGFEGAGPLEWDRYQNKLKYFPAWLEALAWWSAFLEHQFWLLEDSLTVAPQIAFYAGADDRAPLPAGNGFGRLSLVGLGEQVADGDSVRFLERWRRTGTLRGRDPLGAAGFPVHVLSDEQVLSGALGDYKLLVVAAGRIDHRVAAHIRQFVKEGNYLVSYYNSLTWNTRGPTPELFAELLEAKPGPILEASEMVDGRIGAFEDGDPAAKQVRHTTGPLPLVVTAPADDAGPIASALREAGPIRDDRVQTVEPAGARVLATVDGQPAVTTSGDGRRVFVGLQQAGDRTFVPGLLVAMARQAGLRPIVGLEALPGGEAIPQVQVGCLDNVRLKARLVVLVNHGGKVRLRLDTPVPGPGMTAWELVTNRLLEEKTDGKLELEIPARGLRIVLVIAPLMAKRAAGKQAEVAERARLFDFHCSRHFFVRKTKVHPWDDGHSLQQRGEPNAIIVVGDRPPEIDLELASQLQRTIAAWPLAANAVQLRIVPASKLTPAERQAHNLLCFGGPADNALVADWVATGRLRDAPAGAIVSAHERPWYAGGNIVAIVGDTKKRRDLYNRFHGWMRVWMGAGAAYEPGPLEPTPAAGTLTRVDRQIKANGAAVTVHWTVALSEPGHLVAWPENVTCRVRLEPPATRPTSAPPTTQPDVLLRGMRQRGRRHADPLLQGEVPLADGRKLAIQLAWHNASRFKAFWTRVDGPDGPWLAQGPVRPGEKLRVRLRLVPSPPTGPLPVGRLHVSLSVDGITLNDSVPLPPTTK